MHRRNWAPPPPPRPRCARPPTARTPTWPRAPAPEAAAWAGWAGSVDRHSYSRNYLKSTKIALIFTYIRRELATIDSHDGRHDNDAEPRRPPAHHAAGATGLPR